MVFRVCLVTVSVFFLRRCVCVCYFHELFFLRLRGERQRERGG